MRKIALAVALLATFMIATPQSAFAATCSGSTCQGKDPQAAGCSGDAYNLTEMTFNQDRMEMRYSPSCGAVWTRCTTGNISTVNNDAAIIMYSLSSDAYLGKYTVMCSNSAKGNVRWTPMAKFSGQYLRTCGKNQLLYGGPGNEGDWRGDSNAACTGRH